MQVPMETRSTETLEAGVKMAFSGLTWMLRLKLKSFAIAIQVLNHWALLNPEPNWIALDVRVSSRNSMTLDNMKREWKPLLYYLGFPPLRHHPPERRDYEHVLIFLLVVIHFGLRLHFSGSGGCLCWLVCFCLFLDGSHYVILASWELIEI